MEVTEYKEHTENIEHLSTRIWELDFARGVCILLMVMDHALYDLAFIFRYQWFGRGEGTGFLFWLAEIARTEYFPWILRDIVWAVAVFTFVFLCGLSCSFSHSNLKRGLRLAGIAILLTLFTFGLDMVFDQTDRYTIRFGILHMLSASILLYCLLAKLKPALLAVIAFATIGIGFYYSNQPLETSFAPAAVLVRSTADFYSADYFTLFPWFGFFLLGAILGPILYKKRTSHFPGGAGKGWHRPILFAGRTSLIVYVVHQPIVYGLLSLIGLLFI